MGPSGPPIPPEAIFSVVPYPIERESPRLPECGQRYMFTPFGGFRDDKSKSDVSEVEKPAVTEKKVSI